MNLKDISINIVCKNLYLNYKLCKKYSFKIPGMIADDLFNYLIQNIPVIDEKQFYIFRREICYLTKMKINSNIIKYIYVFNEKNDYLKELCFSCCNLNEIDCKSIEKFLMNCSKIEIINLNNNKNMNNGFFYILDGLKNSSKSIKEINLSKCKLNENQMNEFTNFLKYCNKIEIVNLAYNYRVQHSLCQAFIALENSSNSLKIIDLRFCFLNEIQTKILSNLVEKCSKIECIKLTMVEKIEFSKICFNLFKCVKTLNEINLTKSSLNDKNIIGLRYLLLRCHGIQKVKFECNTFIDNGFSIIFDSLKSSSSSLKELHLRNCHLKKKHSKDLKNLLSNCKFIQRIDISGNTHLTEGYFEIFKQLENSCYNLKEIDISYTDLNDKQCHYLKNLLILCHKIRYINLEWNRCMGNGLLDICNGLSSSYCSLKKLNVSFCNLNIQQKNALKILSNCLPNLKIIS